jgi:hypothetical protein
MSLATGSSPQAENSYSGYRWLGLKQAHSGNPIGPVSLCPRCDRNKESLQPPRRGRSSFGFSGKLGLCPPYHDGSWDLAKRAGAGKYVFVLQVVCVKDKS